MYEYDMKTYIKIQSIQVYQYNIQAMKICKHNSTMAKMIKVKGKICLGFL